MKDLFDGIYKNRKVMITGHTGFKGSWLSLWLSLMGAKVCGYALNPPTTPNHFSLVSPKIKSVKGDILNKKKISETISEFKPEIIFHLAAQPIVRTSYEEPYRTITTNINGALNVLESARVLGMVKAIVVITSDKCYKNYETNHAYKEDEQLGGDDPYSASKACVEIVSNAYRRSFLNENTFVANVRAGNVIGGGDWAKDRLIPDIMRAASRKEPVFVRSPYSVRPWQHVLEPLSGYLLIGEKLLEGNKKFADDWNFGPDKRYFISVKDVVSEMKNNWNTVNIEYTKSDPKKHEAKLLTLDSAKANRLLKWKTVWSPSETFKKTANWYRNYYENEYIDTIDNLNEYINDAKEKNLIWA